MVSRGRVGVLGVSLAALLFLSVEASAVMAQSGACSVEVSPRAGAAGTVFVFSGSGFKPTELTLHKDDSDAGVHDVDVGTEDPWQVSVRSRPGDEGAWVAELSSDACSATAQFRVTLNNTDAVSDAVTPPASAPAPLALALFVIGAGLGGGLFFGRRLLLAAADNRAQ